MGGQPAPSNIFLFWDDQKESFPFDASIQRIIPLLGNPSNLARPDPAPVVKTLACPAENMYARLGRNPLLFTVKAQSAPR